MAWRVDFELLRSLCRTDGPRKTRPTKNTAKRDSSRRKARPSGKQQAFFASLAAVVALWTLQHASGRPAAPPHLRYSSAGLPACFAVDSTLSTPQQNIWEAHCGKARCSCSCAASPLVFGPLLAGRFGLLGCGRFFCGVFFSLSVSRVFRFCLGRLCGGGWVRNLSLWL